MPGVPVKVDLNGASEFDLKVENGGGGVIFRINFDRTDWADAHDSVETPLSSATVAA